MSHFRDIGGRISLKSSNMTSRPLLNVVSFASLVFFFLTGCSDSLQKRFDRLEASQKDLRSLQSEQTTQLDAVQADLRTLQGRLEELEFSQNRKIGGEMDQLKSQLTSLRRRVPPPAVVPAALLDQDENLVANMPPELGSRFAEALTNIREGKFSDAIPLLQSVLDGGVGKDFSANTLFWLGVCYDGVSDSKNALLAYNQIVSVYPSHLLVPTALYRQAGVLERIRDTKTATIILRKLIADFPRSPEAAQARDRLKSIG